ncbi:MAG TPA: hypothetical protein VIK74_07705, partial [Parasegetibacter sp.]
NNTVLEDFKGFQAGGINNTVKGSVKGWQVAGIYNHTRDSVTGVQVGGVGNFAGKRVNGVQIAGVTNIAVRRVNGTQIAGVVNWSHREINGTQIAGVVNYAKSMRGVMIGLINIADTIDGYSVGLINIIFKGYHKLSAYATESQHFNLAFKTGSTRLYNILQAGMNVNTDEKLFSFGYGLGSENRIIKNWLTVNPELTSSYIYAGSWDYFNLLMKVSANINIKLGKYISLFGGPSYNAFYSDQNAPVPGYTNLHAPGKFNAHRLNDQIKGWIGWNAGINIF